MEKLLLGIDIGTSACKVAVFTLDGEAVAQASAEYGTFYPEEGWAEQNPDDWWEGVCTCIRRLKAEGVPLERLGGIGIDGQSWSAIPLTADGRVLYNTPIWYDTRAADICGELSREIGEEELFSLCGNPLQPAYTLPKILWFKRYRKDVYEKAHMFLQANSYIAYRLTGAFTQDMSQGYGLHCYNMRTGQWDEEMCARMGIDIQKLPEIFPCHQVVGSVTGEAAEKAGLPQGVPVVAGGLDAACGALGVGVLEAGDTQEQGGQAGGMSICMDSYHADPRLILSHHVVPGRWLLQGGSVGGGGIMRWLDQELGTEARLKAEQNGTSPLYELDREAEKVSPGSDGVVFLPYMAGERSPIWDVHAKGVFYGLSYSSTRGHMIRAAMEGVVFALNHNLEVAQEAGVEVKVLRSMGGAANSRLWTQMKADVTGKSIQVPSSDTATTLGAVILAGVGTGLYSSFEEAVKRTVAVQRYHEPQAELFGRYQKGYQKYRSLYTALKPIMREKKEETNQ